MFAYTDFFIMSLRNWFFFPAFFFLTFSFCSSPSPTGTRNGTKKERKQDFKHRSITFIVGEDKSANKYYTYAAKYFRQHEMSENNKVIIAPLSFIEIMNYLNTIPDNEKWDKINIISHGNSWTGLAVKIKKNGPRTTLESVMDAQSNGELPVLKNGIYDEHSRIILYACGLGLNEGLMYKLKEVLAADKSPIITSTKLFNIFSAGPTTSKHSLAYFYNSFYRPDRYLGKGNLEKQLRSRYPDVDIDWMAALKRKLPDYPGQAFSYKYHIPISWTEVYLAKADRPSLKSRSDIINWVLNQPEFLRLVEEYDIPLIKYQWSVQYLNYTNADGETRPAMRVKGKTTVVSVLKELVDPSTKETYVPELNDEQYFMTL